MDWLLDRLDSLWSRRGGVVLHLGAGRSSAWALVIFVHELGHFLVAKACGVKCEKFYVGFDVPISIPLGKLGTLRLPRRSGKSSGARPNTASASCRWAAT